MSVPVGLLLAVIMKAIALYEKQGLAETLKYLQKMGVKPDDAVDFIAHYDDISDPIKRKRKHTLDE